MTFEGGRDNGPDDGARAGAGGELIGTWVLDVKTPFGAHPATLHLRRDADGSLDGDIDSRLGNAALSRIRLVGEDLEAVVSIHLQGREFTAGVTARAAAGRMSGTIKVNIPGAPAVKFTGVKQ